MATIKGLYKRVQALNSDEVIEDAFIENEKQFAEKNRQQLFSGFDKNGKRLKPYKNKRYADKKHAMNPKPGHGNPDFRLKSDFYRGIEVRIDGQVIRTILNDPKSTYLLQRDPDIVGLGGEFKEQMNRDHLQPSLTRHFRKNLKL
jgi:hypothetical protein